MSDTNLELNKSRTYKNKKCTFCGRRFPKTLLNIEGYIHHGQTLRCLDQKTCNRIKKRSNK